MNQFLSMPIETLEVTLAVGFLLVGIASLYLFFVPGKPFRSSLAARATPTADPAHRSRRFIVRMVLGILLLGVMLPLVYASRDRAFASMFNNPREWISSELPAEKRYVSFIQKFHELDVVVISWRGCHVDDERLPQLARELTTSTDAERRRQCTRYFTRVVTGYDTMRELMAAPLNLGREQALTRLTGSLVGPDGETSCAVVYLGEEGVSHRARAVDLLREIVQEICQLPATEIIIAGAPVDGVAIDRNSVASADSLGLPSNIIVLLLCRLCLRSWRLTLVVFSVALVGQLLSVALIDWFGHRMNAILIVMPPLVLVLTVSAGVHLVNYYHDEVRQHGHAGAAHRAVLQGRLPCFVATTTTVIGLLSLLASDSLPIRLFAVFSSICIATTISLLFFILPGAMELWPVHPNRRWFHNWATRLSQRITSGAGALVCRSTYPILIVCLSVMVLGGYGLTKLDTSVDVRVMFPEKSKVLQNYQWLEARLGPTVPVEVVLGFNKRDRVELAEQVLVVAQVHEAVQEIDAVSGVLSAVTFLPEFSITDSPSADKRQFPIHVLAKLRARMLELPYVKESHHGQHWRISARVPALADIDYGSFLDHLADHVEPVLYAAEERLQFRGISATYTGPMPITYAAQRALLDDLIHSFIAALMLITLVMIVYLRSILAGLVIMLPNLFPTVLLFGLTGLQDVAIDIGSVMTASVALGIAVDDTLHFVTWFRREYSQSRDTLDAIRKSYGHCGWAMIQSTLICGLGIFIYTLSPFVPAQQFALMMMALLVAALVGDLLLLPALLASPVGVWLRPQRDELRGDARLKSSAQHSYAVMDV